MSPTIAEMSGELSDRPLSRLLLELFEGRATGTLEIRRARVEKRIDLVVGHPIAVTSNQRQETLGHFLVGRKLITEELHQAVRAILEARAREQAGAPRWADIEAQVQAGTLDPRAAARRLLED